MINGFWLAVVSAVGSNEHAVEGGRHGDLHRDTFRLDSTSLRIKMEGPIETANRELKAIITNLWRGTPASVLDPIFPPAGSGELSGTGNRLIACPCFSAPGLNEYATQFRWLG